MLGASIVPRIRPSLILSTDSSPQEALHIFIQALIHAIHRIRLNSFDFRDLKDKLQAPVQNARQILIQQSLSEKFIQAFYETASANPKYRMVNTQKRDSVRIAGGKVT